MSKTLFVCAVAALLLGAVPTNGNKLLSHLGLRSQCIRGPGRSNTGTYGPFRTNFYFPRRKNCQEYVNGGFKEQKNSCIQLHIANSVRNRKLARFIDVARIRNIGRKRSNYYFQCANGKEVCNSHFRNGDPGTLCHLLNQKDPCKSFSKRIYEVNGCSKPDCEEITGLSDPRLNRRLRLTVYVDSKGVYGS